MIRSFFKKVFSSSNEVSATVETLQEAVETNKTQGLEEGPIHELSPSTIYKVAEIEGNWLEAQLIQKLDDLVRSCFEETNQGADQPIRIRLRLGETLRVGMNDFAARRLRDFLDLCEQEIMDLTFFLDKKDAVTMELYKTYLLPESNQLINPFLRDRCMMIYVTSESLARDYHKEMEDFFEALGISMDPSFFSDFEQFKEQILLSQEETQYSSDKETRQQVEVISPLMIEVSREEVENENILQLDKYMENVLLTPQQARSYESNLLFSFYGFGKNEDLVRMMNRKEIKEWASILVEKHPYIFYFLNDEQYPMTKFLTSLVVTTEVEDGAVYYNEEELSDFRAYIRDTLIKLANWLDQDEQAVLEKFESNFQE
ncbi:MAG TPA: hypothetical protein VJ824_08225 [Bacillota bacterium]|nr:hypothetical protein [Bacillota bacterium]